MNATEQDTITKQAEHFRSRNVPIFHDENGKPTHWWASLCSAHYLHNKDCLRCARGTWVKLPLKDPDFPAVTPNGVAARSRDG